MPRLLPPQLAPSPEAEALLPPSDDNFRLASLIIASNILVVLVIVINCTLPCAVGPGSSNEEDHQDISTTVQGQNDHRHREGHEHIREAAGVPNAAFFRGVRELELSTIVCDGNVNNNCAVCLDELKAGNECRVLPHCNHVFHKPCIDQWLDLKNHCPLCRVCVGVTIECFDNESQEGFHG